MAHIWMLLLCCLAATLPYITAESGDDQDRPCPEGSLEEGGYSGMCQNGGTCVIHHDTLVSCQCASGYYGERCQLSRVGSSRK
ncbi:pro-epidermal growth factor-like [Branchiostoma floridae x Branchiostoma belcheri]